jgi:hypothetical protein
MTLEECIKANMDKLSKRYPQGSYSNNAAIARADKALETYEPKPIPNIEDDFEDVKIEQVACNLGEECESCQ